MHDLDNSKDTKPLSEQIIERFLDNLNYVAWKALQGKKLRIRVADCTEAAGFMGLQDGDVIPTTFLVINVRDLHTAQALQVSHGQFTSAARNLGIDVVDFAYEFRGDEMYLVAWDVSRAKANLVLRHWERKDCFQLLTLCSSIAAFRDTHGNGYSFPQAWEDLNFGDAAEIPEHFEKAFAHLDPLSSRELLAFCESLLHGLMTE